jgi:hypothetical protein
MKNIIKQIFFYLMLLGYLNLYAQNTDCPVFTFANDLSASTAEFKAVVNESKGFDAWQFLNKEKPTLRTNIEELNLVSKNLDEINNAGGYLKWKAVNSGGSLSDLLKNSKFKAIYEPLENGNLLRKYAQYNITTAEEASLKLFIQDDYYTNFNKALAGEIPMTAEYSTMKDLMISAHSKLPKQIGVTVFRGAGTSESIFAKSLSRGQKFNFEGRFTSSSIDDFIANDFRRAGKGDVIWQIESKTGVDLKLINSSESEVLFKPFTKYELIDIVPNAKTPNVFIYKIKEL